MSFIEGRSSSSIPMFKTDTEGLKVAPPLTNNQAPILPSKETRASAVLNSKPEGLLDQGKELAGKVWSGAKAVVASKKTGKFIKFGLRPALIIGSVFCAPLTFVKAAVDIHKNVVISANRARIKLNLANKAKKNHGFSSATSMGEILNVKLDGVGTRAKMLLGATLARVACSLLAAGRDLSIQLAPKTMGITAILTPIFMAANAAINLNTLVARHAHRPERLNLKFTAMLDLRKAANGKAKFWCKLLIPQRWKEGIYNNLKASGDILKQRQLNANFNDTATQLKISPEQLNEKITAANMNISRKIIINGDKDTIKAMLSLFEKRMKLVVKDESPEYYANLSIAVSGLRVLKDSKDPAETLKSMPDFADNLEKATSQFLEEWCKTGDKTLGKRLMADEGNAPAK